MTQAKIREDVIEQLIKVILPANLLDENTRFYVNPTGRFNIGGPVGDAGLPDARSSSIRTAASRGTAAARSPGKTRQKWIARVEHGALRRQEYRRGRTCGTL